MCVSGGVGGDALSPCSVPLSLFAGASGSDVETLRTGAQGEEMGNVGGITQKGKIKFASLISF